MARPTDFEGETERAGERLSLHDAERTENEARPHRKFSGRRNDPEEREAGFPLALLSGIALGVVLGAGIALLTTPYSGDEVRERIADGARRVGGRVAEGWDDVRDEADYLARRGRRRVNRGLARSRWAAEDAIDRGRHRMGW
ncbi:MAG TPA: YtxH domain-containing protein [Gemmatimonadaceae bacterium]|nr:YtxH domain-containing protein [Gemmatimonadaceae bacterium]